MEPVELGYKQEVETGPGHRSLCALTDGEPREYDIEICSVSMAGEDDTKNLVIQSHRPGPAGQNRGHCPGHERHPHPAKREAGGRSDPCVCQRPHHGLRHLCGNYDGVSGRGGYRHRIKGTAPRQCFRAVWYIFQFAKGNFSRTVSQPSRYSASIFPRSCWVSSLAMDRPSPVEVRPVSSVKNRSNSRCTSTALSRDAGLEKAMVPRQG